MTWWRMPLRLLRAYADMLSRLQAEETLQMATAAALGAGSLRQHEARRLLAALQRQARGGGRSAPRQRVPVARSAQEAAALLRLAGVPVEVTVDG